MSTQTHPSSSSSETPTRRVAVVSASVRAERMNPTITDWVIATIDEIGGVKVDLIDLAETTLPDDSQLQPGGGSATLVADRIQQAEGFVFVTPEYNHSYPTSLKRLIDWHYSEWMLKPALLVAYGVQGGFAAIEHLRGVLAELHVVTTRRVLGLPMPWNTLDEEGRFAPEPDVTKALTAALAELGWWAEVLTDARGNRKFPG